MSRCEGMRYTVKAGDTMYSLSMGFGVPLNMLLRANPHVDVYNLEIGSSICIPGRTPDLFQGREESFVMPPEAGNPQGPGMPPGAGNPQRPGMPPEAGISQRPGMSPGAGNPQRPGMPPGAGNPQGPGMPPGVGNASGLQTQSAFEMLENMDEETDMENEEKNTQQVQNNDKMNIDMEIKTWERYVAKPGDTLDIVIGTDGSKEDHDIWVEFFNKNAMSQIYILPGTVYYRES